MVVQSYLFNAASCLQLIILPRERALTDLLSIHLAQNTTASVPADLNGGRANTAGT
ncbi:hypothetical protein K0M31_019747, partial [Melipona bicolor]